jgi:exosortase
MSATTTPPVSTLPGRFREPTKLSRTITLAVFLGLLLLVLYATVLTDLAHDWWTDEGSSYGMLVPVMAGYIAWIKREEILAAPTQEDGRALWAVGGACLMYLVGRFGAEFFLTRTSFVVLLTGLIWLFWGTARLRKLSFPLVLLATMVPLPALVYNKIAIPLQLFSSGTATAIMQNFGLSVYRDGNIIELPRMTLGVAEACSGLHSITALAVGALLVGYIWCRRFHTRLALFLLAIPIAIALNVVRITGTAVLATHYAELATGFYHLFSGWLVFVASVGLLLLCARGLHWLLD